MNSLTPSFCSYFSVACTNSYDSLNEFYAAHHVWGWMVAGHHPVKQHVMGPYAVMGDEFKIYCK